MRSVTTKLAALLEVLELEQPRVVSRDDLQEWGREVGVTWPVDVSVRRLRDRGWLLDLTTRGVWEFAPASRAGPFGAGDPLIELRATLRRHADAPLSVAAESAAYLLGYATRRPAREVIGAPPSVRVPPALHGYRLVHWLPRTPCVVRDALPVWSAPTLLAFMASRPALYGDWPNVGDWLRSATVETRADQLVAELAGRPRSTWARAAYLVARGGREDVAQALLATAPQGRGPYYLGDRSRSGRYDAGYDVIDSTGLELADS